MSIDNPTNLTVAAAQKILNTFSCIDTKPINSVEETLVRQAVLLLVNLSDSQNLGICADSIEQGFLALKTYLKAFGYQLSLNQADITSLVAPVYIKFNIQKQSYYLDSYTGNYRGVLISCQCLQDESINGTYGHLPLDLFVDG